MKFLILFSMLLPLFFPGSAWAEEYYIDKTRDLESLSSEIYKDFDGKLKPFKDPIKVLFVLPKNESKIVSDNDVMLLDTKTLLSLKKRVVLVERDGASLTEAKGARVFSNIDLQNFGKKWGTAIVARLLIQDNFTTTPTGIKSPFPDEVQFKVILVRTDNGTELANFSYIRKLKVYSYVGSQFKHRIRDIALGTGAMSLLSAGIFSYKANLEKKSYDDAESSGDSKQLRRRTEADKQFAYGCLGISLIAAGIAGWIYYKDVEKRIFHFELLPPVQASSPNSVRSGTSIGVLKGGLTWNF